VSFQSSYWTPSIALAIRVHHITLHLVLSSSRSHNRKESSYQPPNWKTF